MTAVLAIDVTGPGGGAALLADGAIRTGIIPPTVARGRDLVPEVKRLIEDAGIRPQDLAGIACAIGPGSFTGIRIGIATAATLAYAAEIPVAAVGSLHGIAASAPADRLDVAVALNARREHVFAARFRRTDAGLELQREYRHVPASSFASELADDTYLLGDPRTAKTGLFERFFGSEESTVRPDEVARIGAARFNNGEGIAPAELRPMYLRLSDPEIRRAERP